MGRINQIVVHCSVSEFGTAVEIDKWHRKRGWSRIGYMGVILNGYPLRRSSDAYWPHSDGAFEWGRPPDTDNMIEPGEIEAHAFGINSTSVGICLIGDEKFSDRQFIKLRKIIRELCQRWGLTYDRVIGHYEVPNVAKTCPNFNMDIFRKYLEEERYLNDLMVKHGRVHNE